MQLIRLLATFTAVLLGGHLLSSCGGKTSPKSTGGNEGPSGPTSEIELSGSIADEAPVDFVQSSSSVSVGQVNLTDATSYVVKAYSLEPRGSKKEIFTGSFAEPNFSFKSTVARQYMLIEITRLPDGGQYGAVLPPPTSNKQASLVVDGTTTIAAKMATLIASKAESGDQGAQQALTSGSVSVADLLMIAQSVRTTVIEQKQQNKGSAIDLSNLATNLILKSNELVAKLNAEGQSGAVVAEKLSEASYRTIFGDDAKVASAGVLAYRVNPDLGSSETANTTIAYEAIKASSSDSMKPVDEAFRVESTAYRTAATVAEAVAAKTTVASDFKAVFTSCMSSPSSCAQSVYAPPKPQVSGFESVKAPGVPTSVFVTAGNTQVSLIWAAPANTGGSSITDYIIQYSFDSGSNWTTFSDGTSTSTNFTITGLTNGNTYVFRVAATNAAGTGSYSASSPSVTPVTTPSAPTLVTGTTTGYGRVALTWVPPVSDGGALPTDYLVEYSTESGSTWMLFPREESALTSATVTGLTTGTVYVFRVAARNSAGIGDFSEKSPGVTPQAWTEVTVEGGTDITVRDNATSLWWSNPRGEMSWNSASAHCEGLSYNGQNDWRLPDFEELGAASFIKFGSTVNPGWTTWITNSNLLYKQLWSGTKADNGNFWTKNLVSGFISQVNASADVVCVRWSGIKPDTPVAVIGTAGDGKVELNWTERGGGASAITDYDVQYSSNNGTTWTRLARVASTAASATVMGLTNGTEYVFRVAAKNSAGISNYSASSMSFKPPGWSVVTLEGGSEITMRNNATGLWFSNDRGPMNWEQAQSSCAFLSYNGQNGWRLPSQQELFAAYENKIGSQAREGWITDFKYQAYWSSSRKGSPYDWDYSYYALAITNFMWPQFLNFMVTDNTTVHVVCVRQP